MVKNGDNVLMGEYHHNIDDKNRIIIPAKFRDELKENFVVTKGLEGCLFVYPENEWNTIVSQLKNIPFTKKDARNFTRVFMASASMLDFDKQGRINIPKPLVEYAKLDKECVVIGVNDRLEIWDKVSFDHYINDTSENLSDIADNLFSGGLDL